MQSDQKPPISLPRIAWVVHGASQRMDNAFDEDLGN